MKKNKKLIFNIIKYFVGLFFLLSAVMKLVDFQNSVLFFSDVFNLTFGWSKFGLFLIILLELVFAAAMMQKKFKIQLVYSAMIVALVLFSGVSLVFFGLGLENCGCFGTIVQTDPILTIGKNILLIGLVLFLKKHEGGVGDG